MNAVEAVARAKELAIEVFGDDAGSIPRLEEIVPLDDWAWDITLSFKRTTPLSAGTLAINMAPHLANYEKVIRLNRQTGDLILIQDVDRAA
jgi:hypothetical protein